MTEQQQNKVKQSMNEKHNDYGNKTFPNRIELRSEKIRKFIGEIPPAPVRWGTVLIVLIFIALILAATLIPYPHSEGESILIHLFR